MDKQSLIAYTPCSSASSRASRQLVAGVKSDKRTEKKVLEEDEYLDRMGKIIRRDFFPGLEFANNEEPDRSYRSNATTSAQTDTPGTNRTDFSTTSSLRSRQQACSLRLNDYLEKYTSEDNDYFDKLQRREARKHRTKHPWLYKDTNKHNKLIHNQLKLTSSSGAQAELVDGSKSETKMIDWPHNPTNSLFYAPKDPESTKKSQTVINYKAIRSLHESVFKEPLVPRSEPLAAPPPKRSFNTFSDKIGIDGKLINANVNETPAVNGYSFIPAPETPLRAPVKEEPRVLRSDTDRFHIPGESAREELAHRMYQEKVAKSIRTPKTGSSNYSKTPSSSLRTPSSMRKSYAEFSFSPERVCKTPKKR